MTTATFIVVIRTDSDSQEDRWKAQLKLMDLSGVRSVTPMEAATEMRGNNLDPIKEII